LHELWRRSSYERGLISDPFGNPARAEQGLARMSALLVEHDNPQTRVPTVHIAGSKGKGSTAAFVASAARAAGHRVGLYTSPHLHRFPERIAIAGSPLTDQDFASVAERVAGAAERMERDAPDLGTVTTFEFVTAMAFAAFARAACDLAVIEVGLGGRYDATNVLHPLVSVITRIDLEHTAVLGTTHAEIAAQKAGILVPGVPCVSSPQVATAQATIERAAAAVGSPLFIAGRDWTWHGTWRAFTASGPWGEWHDLALAVPGDHQVENACTALAALHIVNQSGIALSEDANRAGLAQAHWPGRFERIRSRERDIVLDGAHTPAAAKALRETWQQEVGAVPATVVLGMSGDKDITAFLRAIHPITERVLAIRSASPRAADPAAIAAAARALNMRVETFPSVATAIDAALTQYSGPLLVTGSLFVAGEGREALGLAEPDTVWPVVMEAGAKQIS
jgi:dihydrofolate synthase/folylpolyglutamate synthase